MTFSPEKCVIIAEAGVNHNGSVGLAKELASAAHEAGADYVKYQTFNPNLVASSLAPVAKYQEAAGFSDQKSMLAHYVLSDSEHRELLRYCEAIGIGFSSTAHDLDSANYLQSLGQDFVKVGSGDLMNWQLLESVARFGLPLVVSTGASSMDDVEATMDFLVSLGLSPARDIILMQCTSAYPAPSGEANARVLSTYQEVFGCRVGYSDHTQGIEPAIAAVALGASVIEKHITLDKNMEGPDHKASLEPAEFKAYVQSIRKVEGALGSNKKFVTPAEENNQALIRKSLYARLPIAPGEQFSDSNVIAKRPFLGFSASKWPEIKGQISRRHYAPDELIDEK
jgi:N,N'-diacetyllegionaminate synthase